MSLRTRIKYVFFSGQEIDRSALQLVQIFFDTASFDEIERDKKIKFEAQLSLIGGTMGLLTGFSIISGIELVCFVVKLFLGFFYYNQGLNDQALVL